MFCFHQYFEDLPMARSAYMKISSLFESKQTGEPSHDEKNKLQTTMACCRGLAKIEFQQEHWDSALEYLNKEMDYVVQMYGESHIEYVLCLEDKIDTFHKMKNDILCFQTLETAIEILESSQCKSQTNEKARESKLCQLYFKMSQMMIELDRHSDSIHYLHKLETVLPDAKDSNEKKSKPSLINLFTVYETLGMLYLLVDDLALSEKYFEKCLEIENKDDSNDVTDIEKSLMNVVSAKQL